MKFAVILFVLSIAHLCHSALISPRAGIHTTARLTAENESAIAESIAGSEAKVTEAEAAKNTASTALTASKSKSSKLRSAASAARTTANANPGNENLSKEAEEAEKAADEADEEVTKAEEELQKAEQELGVARLTLSEELLKATITEREKFAEEISKEVEDAFKSYNDALSSGETPTLRSGNCRSEFESFTLGELFLTAAFGSGVGKCKIQVNPDEHPLCFLYVLGATPDVFNDFGFPKQKLPDGTLSGNGCVWGNDGPKPFEGTACQYRLPGYNLAEDIVWRICQKFTFSNAYNQLLLAIRENACGLSC